MSAPRATYRLQLRRHGVDLDAARRLLPHLARLGVSHLYLSPFLKARSGSTHGYDVVDPGVVDPALGGEPALARLARSARDHGLSLIADVVPNHMAAHPENPWFADLLVNGAASRYAGWFDVDWERAGGRIVLPILGEARRACLSSGAIGLVREQGEVRLRAGGTVLPLSPATRPHSTRATAAALARLLDRQHYRLVYWRTAGDRINYRRFFDVNDLIAIRSDESEVFAATHAALARHLAEGRLAGVRVDHVDGLADPDAYLARLRAIAPVPALVFVEKILARDESLPARWPVDGTTGYEFLNAAEAVFLDPEGALRRERGWRRRTRVRGRFEDAARAAKRRVAQELLRPELARAARALVASRRRPPQLQEAKARETVLAFASHLDVYRVYPRARGLDRDERRRVRAALAGAAREGAPPAGIAALRQLLLGRSHTPVRLAAGRRVQQLCVSVAAKGVEDTAFYDHAPLLSLAEVGGEPTLPLDDPLTRFHAEMAARVRRPRGLLAASTHDTKRSADVRARLDVLSEDPGAWLAAVDRWRQQNAPLRRRLGGPDPRSELFFYRSLVGIWPLAGLAGAPAAVRRELAERLETTMLKAAREAKRATSWVRPDARFERALCAFVHAVVLPPGGRSEFLTDVERFVEGIARPGLWNAVARRLLQLTAPGIPDLYQGEETWRFDLVDPDNRRPVDFAALRRRLAQVERIEERETSARVRMLRGLVRSPDDGRLPLLVVHRALAARARQPELFLCGSYRPLRAEGEGAGCLLAFVRRRGAREALVVAPRLTTRLSPRLAGGAGAAPVGAAAWGDTQLVLPRELVGRRARCALTGRRIGLERRTRVGELLDPLPLALLVT